MDRLTSVEWLRMKADGFYNVFEQERFLEAADEIERLREALSFYAEWGIDAPAVDAIIEHDRGDIARSALQQKESK